MDFDFDEIIQSSCISFPEIMKLLKELLLVKLLDITN
jgi:hypothetical protein